MRSKRRAAALSKKAYQKFGGRSLFSKYFTLFAGMMLICFIVLEATLWIFVTDNWTNQTRTLLADNAKIVARTASRVLRERMETDPVGSTALICSTLSLVSDAIGADIYIADTQGNVLLCKDVITQNFDVSSEGSCPLHGKYQIPQEIMQKAVRGSYSERGTLGGVYLEKQLVASEPIRKSGQTVAVVFAAASAMSGFRNYTAEVLKTLLFATLLALAVGFVIVYFFTVSLIRPLKEMSDATKAYAQGDFSPRVHTAGNDELAELVQAFNKMASDMSRLESSRRSFVANVSHELKTPITTIGGFIDGLLDGTIPADLRKHYLELVSDETKRLARLVTAMLNMSKIEAGELRLDPRTFDISADIFQVLLSFERAVERKNIEIAGLETLRPAMVTADKDLIHQVLYNLFDNAVKFTENGTIGVAVDDLEFQTVVRIRNTGAGISPEDRSKIFERFYKVDKSRSYDVKGAGLGLYICKTIVEMHGGKIGCESSEGEFTEFWFLLPRGEGI